MGLLAELPGVARADFEIFSLVEIMDAEVCGDDHNQFKLFGLFTW